MDDINFYFILVISTIVFALLSLLLLFTIFVALAPTPLQSSRRSLESMFLNGAPSSVVSFLDELSTLSSEEGSKRFYFIHSVF